MKATTLARVGPESIELDNVDESEDDPIVEPPQVAVVFRGRRVYVPADTHAMPLHRVDK